MIARDDIPNVLIEGTKSQMLGLRCPDCNAMIAYSYTESCSALTVKCDCTEDRFHGTYHEPNCVRHFGANHTF